MSGGGAHEYYCSRCKGHTVNGTYCHQCKADVPDKYTELAASADAWAKRDTHFKDSMTRAHLGLIKELSQAVRELVRRTPESVDLFDLRNTRSHLADAEQKIKNFMGQLSFLEDRRADVVNERNEAIRERDGARAKLSESNLVAATLNERGTVLQAEVARLKAKLAASKTL